MSELANSYAILQGSGALVCQLPTPCRTLQNGDTFEVEDTGGVTASYKVQAAHVVLKQVVVDGEGVVGWRAPEVYYTVTPQR